MPSASREPSLYVHRNGAREWCVQGRRHRTDGPAYEMPGRTREWWVHGRLHRLDGPAVERVDGPNEWWIRGVAVAGGAEPLNRLYVVGRSDTLHSVLALWEPGVPVRLLLRAVTLLHHD